MAYAQAFGTSVTVQVIEPVEARTTLAEAADAIEDRARAIGRVAPDTKMKAGETGRFAIDIRKLCLFDPQTEKLLA